MREAVKCAVRNLGRKKFRTIITISSIAVGVASVVLISTIGQVGQAAINQELDGLGMGSLALSVNKDAQKILLDEEDLDLIRAGEEIESAIPVMMEYSSASMRGLAANVAIWGVSDGSNQVFSLVPKYGELFGVGQVKSGANVCLVDANTAKAFYGRENIVGKRLKLKIGDSNEEFTVSGVVESGGNAMQSMIGQYLPMFVYIPYTTMQRVSGRGGFDRIAVTVRDQVEIEAASDRIIGLLEEKNSAKGGYNAENIAQQKEKLNHLMEIVTTVLSCVAGISLVVAGLGIMTVMLVNVSERTREIGIKKSIGASRGKILLEFLTEAFTISALGGILGAALGVSLALIGCLLTGAKLLFDLRMIVFSVGFSVFLGVLFGAYPSWLASKLRPVDALRHE